jgi:hypothetical protein
MVVVLILAACSRLPDAASAPAATAAASAATAATTPPSAATAPAEATPGPTPSVAASPSEGTPCETHYSAERCLAIAELAASYLQHDAEEVTSIQIVPDPNTRIVNGQQMIATYGGATPIFVEVVFTDGSTQQTPICSGIPSGPACTDDPHLSIGGIVPGDGYRDLPCTGDPPTGCATPLPRIDAKAAAAAQPIAVKRLEVPIDHVGAYEVDLGEGSIPNGILTRTSYTLGDDWPDHATIQDYAVRLEVRSLEPDGKPFQNYYAHGWRAGTERIRAVLVFSVTRFDPGAVLDVRDVVVQ